MKDFRSGSGAIAALCLAACALHPAIATAQSTAYSFDAEKWQFSATLYG
jgi:hypothetical protein